MELNHTIVPALEKEESAQFFARIFGVRYVGPAGHFVAVQVNESLTLDFASAQSFESHHLAFKVSNGEFDEIFARLKAEGITYGSGPRSLDDLNTNTWNGGRGVYFKDSNGHVLELLTAT